MGHEVAGIDLKEKASKDILKCLSSDPNSDSYTYHLRKVFLGFKPEYIFHLACIPRVVYSVEEPVKTMKNNVLATTHVLDFAKRVGAKRVIYSGSSSVVGNGDGPASPYGLQKLISEMECKLYSDLYDVDTVSLRYFNVYSPCQTVDGPYATAIANWMHSIREGNNPFITGDGSQRRDMANLEDIVSANIFAMEHNGLFGGQHFDVGTGDNISLNEIKEIALKYHPHVKFDYVDSRVGDVLSTKADTKPLGELGWKHKVSISDGVEKCFQRLRDEL
jgi:UDP-glucose 4-epimerase